MSDTPKNERFNKSIENIIKPNIYDTIIQDVNPTNIPVEFIDYVSVKYNDGSVVKLSAADIDDALMIRRVMGPGNKTSARQDVADVRVFVDTTALRNTVEEMIDICFHKHDLL